MSHPFTQTSSKELLKRVAQQFTNGNTFVQRNSHIVFVCGGSAAKDMRPRFLSYATEELPHLRTFLAEVAQKDYITHPEPAFHNIAEFEDIIGEVSDCVVLFPESPGSYAELGYFAKNEELRKKLLVVNRTDLQGQDSFIALGPIELIDRHSNFRPAIQLQYKKKPQFHLIKERIEKRIERTR
ncbi:hypothetical protein F2P47_12555 [Parvibaculum sedimenti]|uniref:Uncharacterized protein n=1 Tax=Parvibaculum sedimenti TaxID=2608632 RepID=A0A6N6VJ15_9HYPH|nr:retron St85 family effector protein [Parvibaculum sedimenti]KAB7739266.1 hypothetical protein F2P47_12555 [Parvibaculum sedimenti]